jgi:trehalose-phosphatase
VSGRSIADLRRRIDLGSRLFYVGLHGLESAGPGFSRVQREVIDAFDNRLLDVANILRPIIGGIRGVELDVTQAVITLHTPHRSPDALWSRFQLFDIFADLLSSGVVRVIRSQNAIAVLPDAGSSTAEAIRAVGQFLEGEAGTSVYTVYLGEDSSDDDALDSVAEPGAGAGVVIGRRRAQAEFHLPAAELDQFVEALALLRASAPQS